VSVLYSAPTLHLKSGPAGGTVYVTNHVF